MVTNQRDQLLESLRGRKVCMPDLRPIFAGWSGTYHENVNPHWKELVGAVDEKLHECVLIESLESYF